MQVYPRYLVRGCHQQLTNFPAPYIASGFIDFSNVGLTCRGVKLNEKHVHVPYNYLIP